MRVVGGGPFRWLSAFRNSRPPLVLSFAVLLILFSKRPTIPCAADHKTTDKLRENL